MAGRFTTKQEELDYWSAIERAAKDNAGVPDHDCKIEGGCQIEQDYYYSRKWWFEEQPKEAGEAKANMKIKAQLTIDINQYENIKPEIEIEVPDNLKDEELVKHLWDRFHGLVKFRPNPQGLDEQAVQYQKEDKNAVAGLPEANTSVSRATPIKFRPDTMKTKPASPAQVDLINTLAKERGREVDTKNMDSWQASQKIRELKEISVVETDEVIQKAELDYALDVQHEADTADLK